MNGQRTLGCMPIDVALLALSWEADGWRLVVRVCETGGRLLEVKADVYEGLTTGELLDVIDGTLSGAHEAADR